MVKTLRLLLLYLGLGICAWGSPADTDPVVLRGHFVQGGLVYGHTLPGALVWLDGQPIRVSPDGAFLVGFHRDDPSAARLEVQMPDGQRWEQVLHVAARDYRIQRIDGVPSRKVTPRPEDLARIESEAALVNEARRRDDPRTDFAQGFIWPARGRISGVYGSQRILNGVPKQPHYGVDVAAPEGSPVRAPASGIVSLVHRDMFYSGGTLMLDHGHGLSSTFLHLKRILVEQGTRVSQGDVIAEVGATGRVTGAHLDWRMNLFHKRLDPELLVEPM